MSYDYTTADKVQAELRSTTAFGSATSPTLSQVTSWIQEESAQVNQDAGKIFGETSYSETIDYNGEDRITLKHAPIMSVTSLLYSTAALGTVNYGLTATKVEDTDYTTYKDKGYLELIRSQWNPSTGNKRIQLNYTSGYAVIPDVIAKLTTKYVAKRIVDTQLEKDINEKASGKSISVGSISIVKNSDFGVSQYKQLKEDIIDLKESLVTGFGVYRYTTY